MEKTVAAGGSRGKKNKGPANGAFFGTGSISSQNYSLRATPNSCKIQMNIVTKLP